MTQSYFFAHTENRAGSNRHFGRLAELLRGPGTHVSADSAMSMDSAMSIHEILFGWLHLIVGSNSQANTALVIDPDPDRLLEQLQIIPVRTGGFSEARIWKVIREPESAWCLRQWPLNGPTQERLAWIHAQLFAAASRGIPFLSLPVPARPFQKTVVGLEGHFWELSRWLPGEPVLTAGYDRCAMKLAIEAALELQMAFDAEFRLRSRSGSLGKFSPAIEKRFLLLKRSGLHLDTIRSGLETAETGIEQRLVFDAIKAIEHCSDRLISMANEIVFRKFRLQPVLSDLWAEHVLFENGMVSGIIDYGSLCMDIPELPFARLIGSVMPQRESRTVSGAGNFVNGDGWGCLQAIAGNSAANIPLNPEILGFLHKTNVILGCLNWLEWIFVQHREFADIGRAEDRARQLMNAAIELAVRDSGL